MAQEMKFTIIPARKANKKDLSAMFFYVLYYNSEVCGFAEAGFLHEIGR